MKPGEVIGFWRDAVGPKRWFKSDPELDRRLASRFSRLWRDAHAGDLGGWASCAEGALALVLVLDQFPRNIFRGRARAFASDDQARAAAEGALGRGYDLIFPAGLRAFFYLPLMHSENRGDQDRCVGLIAQRLGTASSNFAFALAHRAEIERFGRFPGRNRALGRVSTPQELIYLQSHPSD